MSDSEIAESLIDFCNALESLAVNLRRQIEQSTKTERKHNWDPGKIRWVKAEGFKGEYERSEDLNNIQFKNMVKDLAAHQGKLTCESYFYWLFKNGSVVGRKKRKA